MLRGYGAQKKAEPKNLPKPCYTPKEIKTQIIPKLKKVANFLGKTKKTGRKKREMRKKKLPMRNQMQKHL